jgi:hypothetical protein
MSWATVIFVFIYIIVGAMLGKRYWQRRHGLYKKVFGGGADVIFSSVSPFLFLWPVFMLMPNFRDPELCQCPDHVMTRANFRREAEAYQQALEEERGHGR